MTYQRRDDIQSMATKLLIGLVLGLLFFLIWSRVPVWAATCTWTGSSSAGWTDPNNWTNCNSGGPKAGDTQAYVCQYTGNTWDCGRDSSTAKTVTWLNLNLTSESTWAIGDFSRQGLPPPIVTSTEPPANANDVPLDSSIIVYFDQSVNASTVTDQTFKVTSRERGPHPGEIIVIDDATYEYRPLTPFNSGERVMVSLSRDIRSIDNVSIVPAVWEFRTAVLPSDAVFSTTGQVIGTYTNTYALTLGDIDRDGDLDVLIGTDNVQGADEPDEVWLNDGQGSFVNSDFAFDATDTVDVALGDFDNDGDLDAYLAHPHLPDTIWTNTGAGFVNSGQSLSDFESRAVALGDLNGDGYLDAFVANANPATIWLNEGVGTGLLFYSNQTASSMSAEAVVLGDLDGDRDLDAVIGTGGGQPNRVWLNDSTGVFTYSGQPLGGNDTTDVDLGDIDNDGDLDLLVATCCDQPDEVWLNDGAAFFTLNQTSNPSDAQAVRLGDLDGDGDLDAFVAQFLQEDTVWLNDGGGSFTQSPQSFGNAPGQALALGDLDGDGDLDAFLGNNGELNTVWLNGNNLINISRDTAQSLRNGASIIDTIGQDAEAHWYKITVPDPGSTLTVTLNSLNADLDLFLFAPEIDEGTGQLRDLPIDSIPIDSIPIDSIPIDSIPIDSIPIDSIFGNARDILDPAQITENGAFSTNCSIDNEGLFGNIGETGLLGTLICVSANPDTLAEELVLNVQELAGPYYIAVAPHTSEAVGTPYRLTALFTPPVDPFEPITYTVPASFPSPPSDPSVETVIFFNQARFNQLYTGRESITATGLLTKVNFLANHPDVNGRVFTLDEFPEIPFAYEVWDSQPDNPLAARFVTLHLKIYIYSLRRAYPNLKYMVFLGDDRIFPYGRLADISLFSNERKYAGDVPTNRLSETLAGRYILSDDYYTGLLPLRIQGREFYLPYFSSGRLVETPAEIATAIDAFLANPEITPADAMVTGYDFLIDQAEAISQTLAGVNGLPTNFNLINNTWDAAACRQTLFGPSDPYDLISLNAHFNHYALAPALVPIVPTVNDFVFAAEVDSKRNYRNSLIFSVGCHSGLNVPASDFMVDPSGNISLTSQSPYTLTTDWAQAFSRQGGSFIGNTGFGYGDSAIIAYSEKLMLDFVEQLNYWSRGRPQTVGQALIQAKQRYYNSVLSFNNYDEKVLQIMTLYGLPMLRVTMPSTTTIPPGQVNLALHSQPSQPSQPSQSGQAAFEPGVIATQVDFELDYSPTSVPGQGTFYTVNGFNEVYNAGVRPILPKAIQNVHVENTVAHGALLLGGTFEDMPNFDPVISRVVTDETYIDTEPLYPQTRWFPLQPWRINRFLSPEGDLREQLIVAPGQFRAEPATAPTIGTQRLYYKMQYEIFHAPFTATDFIAPSIWQGQATNTNLLAFRVLVTDDSGSVKRVLVLYRPESQQTWSSLDLDYSATGHFATGSLAAIPEPVYYFIQAVDPTGNVAFVTGRLGPFRVEPGEVLQSVYLPLIVK